MPTLADSQITFLYTRDLAVSAAFYEGALGLPLALDQGTCRIYRVAGQAYVGVCLAEDAPEQPGDPGTDQVIVTLVTDDVDGLYARLVEHDTTVDRSPTHNATYHIYHAFLRDPNGYRIEIQRFDDPQWSRGEPTS